MKNEKMLVLGFGNEILSDDGIGVKIVKHLKNTNAFPNITFETSWLGGLEILEFFYANYDKVVFIDATKTGIDEPGSIRLYNLENFKETLHLSNFHDASFTNTIKLGKKLGYNVPASINVMSIEIVEDKEFSNSFSEEIENKYDEILNSVNDILRSI